jgi:hypothetical protein
MKVVHEQVYSKLLTKQIQVVHVQGLEMDMLAADLEVDALFLSQLPLPLAIWRPPNSSINSI